MDYAIIAAGKGSRLAEEGCEDLKPMVKIGGVTLIERLINIFQQTDADNIFILFNEDTSIIKDFARMIEGKNPNVHIYFKSTESSLHSFCEIINRNPSVSELCLTTTDTIFQEEDFQNYISFFQKHKEIDALMAVTDYVDDESPLYVDFGQDQWISAFVDQSESAHPYVSGGVYCLRTSAMNVAVQTLKRGVSRMRNYQRALLENKLKVKAFPFSAIIDIDHVDDIQKATELLYRPDAV